MSGLLILVFGVVFLVVGALLMIAFTYLIRQGLRPDFRRLPGYEAVPGQIGQAIESDGRVHVSLGANSIVAEDTATTLAGLAMLRAVAEGSSISDRQPVASTGNATAYLLIADTVRRVYQASGEMEKYDPKAIRQEAFNAMTLAGGATAIVEDNDVRANILIGSFGPEVALMAQAGLRKNIPQTIASDRLEGQAVAYTMAETPLIGEELFAASAYLDNLPAPKASLISQDVLRLLVVGVILVGALLTTLGLIG
jgi:hypothetical protein